jgi:hypothetical protein
MIEIGSFIGLDFPDTGEYYQNVEHTARLNSARAGIYHACKLYQCDSVYLPYYLCPSVKAFLSRLGIKTKSYHISKQFDPLVSDQEEGHAFILVNHLGILSKARMLEIAGKFRNVIIDNSAAFFSPPLEGCYTIYSPRKFFGVPDGSYLVGENATIGIEEYGQDISSATASYLFGEIELGTNATYKERMKNEARIDESEPLKMSKLTWKLLKCCNYSQAKQKRLENFMYIHNLFESINLLDPLKYFDETCIPMVYPLVVKDLELAYYLRKRNVYVGRFWNYVLTEVVAGSFEAWLSKYMVPIPIDHRYGKEEMKYIYNLVSNKLRE